MFYLSDDSTMSYEPFNLENNITLDECVIDEELENKKIEDELKNM